MVPVCDKHYHIYNRFRHFGAEIKKLWNYPLNGLFTLFFSTMPNKGKRPAPKQQSTDSSNKRSCLASLLADAVAKDDDILNEMQSPQYQG